MDTNKPMTATEVIEGRRCKGINCTADIFDADPTKREHSEECKAEYERATALPEDEKSSGLTEQQYLGNDPCEPECSHPEHKTIAVVQDEPKPDLSGLLDRADAQQAFIDGLCDAIDKRHFSHPEAMALALGRTATVMMENVAELRAMSESRTMGDTDASRANAAKLAGVYAALVETLRTDIDRFIRNVRMARLVKRSKSK